MLARSLRALLLMALVSTPAAAQNIPAAGEQNPPGVGQETPPELGQAQPLPPLAAPDLPPPTPRPPIVAATEQKRLDLNLSLFDAYDFTTVTDTQPGLPFDPRLSQNGSFSGFNSSLNFVRLSHDHSFSALAGADLRYYTLVPTLLPVDYFGGLNFSSTLGRHVTVHGSGSGGYSPYYSFGSFLSPRDAAVIPTPQADQNVARLDTINGSGSVGLTWARWKKTAVDFGYTVDAVSTPEEAYRLWTQSASATLRRRLTRYSELHVGYAFRESQSGLTTVPRFIAHDINVGIGYHRPLSFSRRTVVGFDVGSTYVAQQYAPSLFITGNASLSYQLNRTWAAGVSFHRDVSTVGAVAIPFASETVSGSLGGLFTKHLAFSLTGGYGRGSSAIAVNNGYQSISSSSRLSYTLTRYLPVYVEYVYYHYQFEQSIGLAPGFPLLVDRQGLRVGLSYSVPLVGRRRARP